MFLWQDMAIIVPIAALSRKQFIFICSSFLVGNTGANPELVKKRPPKSLISRTVLVSVSD